MNNRFFYKVSTIIVAFLILPSQLHAEISSLTAEELTDTYIRDTTVIVQQEEAETPALTVPVTLKVSPLEKGAQVLPEDPTHRVSSINSQLNTYDDVVNQVALDRSLLQPLPESTTKFLRPPMDPETLDQIRDAYGLDPNEPVDLTSLQFNQNVAAGLIGDIPFGTSLEGQGSSFTIRIPNSGNYNTQQINSPNGEISITLTLKTSNILSTYRIE